MASTADSRIKSLPNRPVPASVARMMTPRVVKAKLRALEVDSDEISRNGEALSKTKRGWEDAIVPVDYLEFTVTVDMTSNTLLGVDVDWADGKTLYIKSIQHGALEEWNRGHAPRESVRAGDRIIAVNGHVGDAHAMVRECKEQQRLELLIRSQRKVVVTSQPQIKQENVISHGAIASDDTRSLTKRPRIVADSLYSGMPAPDPMKDKSAGSRAKDDTISGPPAQEDPRLVIFLDIDGVLRRLEGSTISVDGETLPLDIHGRAFASEAVRALRVLVHRTGAGIVLSSEWRRDATLREEVATTLRALGIPGLRDCTCVLDTREEILVGTPTNPDREATLILRWAERRSREITLWLREHPDVVRWVELDDLDLSRADEKPVRLPDTLRMAPGLVLTEPNIGLTLSNARVASEMLLRAT